MRRLAGLFYFQMHGFATALLGRPSSEASIPSDPGFGAQRFGARAKWGLVVGLPGDVGRWLHGMMTPYAVHSLVLALAVEEHAFAFALRRHIAPSGWGTSRGLLNPLDSSQPRPKGPPPPSSPAERHFQRRTVLLWIERPGARRWPSWPALWWPHQDPSPLC